MVKRNIIFALTGFLLITFSGCFTDDVVIDPDNLTKLDRPIFFSGPIAKASFFAEDIFDRLGDSISDNITVEKDGLLCVKYIDNFTSTWDDIIAIEDVNFTKNYPISNTKKSTNAEQIFVERIKLNTNSNQRFDSMLIQEATLALNLQLPSGYTGNIDVEFPELTKDGVVLIFNYDATLPNAEEQQDLAGYKIIFGQGQDSSYFTMNITANIAINTANPPDPNQTPEINVTLSMNGLIPEIVFGRFGQSTIMDRKETLDYSLFEDIDAVDLIEFYDIQMLLEFDNYFGIPYDAILEEAIVRRSSTGETKLLELGSNNTINVKPAEYASEVIPTENSFLYNRTNSNINDVINMFPDKLDYHLLVNINPKPEDLNTDNFVTQDNRISGNINIIIPLWLRTSAYTRIDTIRRFDINNMIDDDMLTYLKSATLSFEFSNWFPFELTAQAYVVDENYVIIDSLFSGPEELLASGILDSDGIDGKVIEPGLSKTDVILTKEKIEFYKEQNVQKILLSTRTITTDNGTQFVKMFDFYGLEFQLNFDLVSNEIEL